ncbi:hypothetical protein P8452_45318 [Trifolium repens]|nr:hypothetical protein P8452_45318 [Trifolium repens]
MRCSSSEPSLNMVTPYKSITQCQASRLWHRVWECQKGNHVSSTFVDGCFKVGSEVLWVNKVALHTVLVGGKCSEGFPSNILGLEER